MIVVDGCGTELIDLPALDPGLCTLRHSGVLSLMVGYNFFAW